MLSLLEKLINEHGSSTILRERLVLIKAEYEALERKCSDLQSKNSALQLEVEQLRSRSDNLESELDILKSGALATYVCDHCGNPDITRIGSRPDPTFGALGVKQKVFKCNKCGQESAFTPEST